MKRSYTRITHFMSTTAIALAVAIAPSYAAPTASSTPVVKGSEIATPEPTVLPTVTPQPTSMPTTEASETQVPSTQAPGTQAPIAENTTSVAPNQVPIAILSPTPETVLDRPATAVTIQYPMDTAVELRVNGQLVDKNSIGRTETHTDTRQVVQTWYGVTLGEGKNTLSVNRVGQSQPEASVIVSVSGAPSKLKVSTVEARIPADGRSVATVVGELLDKEGHRSNWNTLVTLEASEGKFVGVDEKPDMPGFQVESKQGQFSAKLQSSLSSTPVKIRASVNSLEAFSQMQFTTQLRSESVGSGFVNLHFGPRGSNFYDRLQDFLPIDQKNDYQLDASGAGFMTTSIGDWLVTGAFNSERPLNEDETGKSRIFGTTTFTDLQYPTFGDSSTSTRTTPSKDHFFLKFERTSAVPNASSDYFMWGDFNTEEFATKSQEFTATNRALHGFKGNYNIGNLQLSALFSNSEEAFQRDSIAPDGTSGYYFTSRRFVVDGSEKVFLELEELNRPGTVVRVDSLQRGIDYEIDYDRGSILFREPILRTATSADGTLLTRKIVVTYQYEGAKLGDTLLYGGRARFHFSRTPGRESWLGATYWKEDRGRRTFELFGADALVTLGDRGQIIAEIARSSHWDDKLVGNVNGLAYRITAEADIIKGLRARAFYRTAETGFANNATSSFVPGQTRYGADLTGQVAKNTRLKVSVDHEDNFGIAPLVLSDLDALLSPGVNPTPGQKQDNSLTTVTAGVEQKIGSAALGLNLIHRDRNDRITGDKDVSNQLEGTFAMPLRQNLQFKAAAAVNLSSDEDPIYTNRVQAGLNWQVHPNVALQLNQYYYWGGQYGDRAVTSLDTVSNYNLFKNTQLTGRFSLLGGSDAITGQGAAGIKHHWNIAPGINMDLGYEYVMGQFFGRTAAGTQYQQPYAVGSGASALGFNSGHNFSIGFDYTDNPDLRASLRYQYRTSATGTNSVLTGDLNGKLTSYLTGLARYEQAGAANQVLDLLGDSIKFRVGLAYRDPKNDEFNALFRYEFRQNPATIPDTILLGSGTGSTDHTLAFEGIYAPDWRWEFYGKFGYRNSTSRIADDFTTNGSMLLGQLRATYRFDYRWDVTAEGRMLSSLSGGGTEFGASAEVGYYLTPYLRFAAGYAFGSAGDRDFDSSRSVSGPYVDFTVKLDTLFSGFSLKKKTKTPKPQVQAVDVKDSLKTESLNTSSVNAGSVTSSMPQTSVGNAVTNTPSAIVPSVTTTSTTPSMAPSTMPGDVTQQAN